MCAPLHFNICKEKRVKLENKPCYDHVPKSVETCHGGEVAILWKQQERTDRNFPNNKPGIIIRDNKQGICLLINVAIPGDRNVIKTEAEKF